MSQQVLNFIQIILNECESLGEPGIRNCDVNIRLSPGLRSKKTERERESSSLLTTFVHIIHRLYSGFFLWLNKHQYIKETLFKAKNDFHTLYSILPLLWYTLDVSVNEKFVIEIWFYWAIRKQFFQWIIYEIHNGRLKTLNNIICWGHCIQWDSVRTEN